MIAMAVGNRILGRHEEALEHARRGLRLNGSVVVLLVAVIISLVRLDRMDEAQTAARALAARIPSFRVSHYVAHLKRYRNATIWREADETLRMAGLHD